MHAEKVLSRPRHRIVVCRRLRTESPPTLQFLVDQHFRTPSAVLFSHVWLFSHLCPVSVKCFKPTFVSPAFHSLTTNQFFYRVLTHFRQVHSSAYTKRANFICYRSLGNYSLRSPVLGGFEI